MMTLQNKFALFKRAVKICYVALLAITCAGTVWTAVTVISLYQHVNAYNSITGMFEKPMDSDLEPSYICIYNNDANASCTVTVSTGAMITVVDTPCIINRTVTIGTLTANWTAGGNWNGGNSNLKNYTFQTLGYNETYAFSTKGYQSVTKTCAPGSGAFFYFYGTREFAWRYNYSSSNVSFSYSSWSIDSGASIYSDLAGNESGVGMRRFTNDQIVYQYECTLDRVGPSIEIDGTHNLVPESIFYPGYWMLGCFLVLIVVVYEFSQKIKRINKEITRNDRFQRQVKRVFDDFDNSDNPGLSRLNPKTFNDEGANI